MKTKVSGAPIRDEILARPGWYLVSDAAKKVGRSKDTLRRWRVTGTFIPSGWMEYGHTSDGEVIVVPLYSEQDIIDLKQIAKTIRPGRKPANDE